MLYREEENTLLEIGSVVLYLWSRMIPISVQVVVDYTDGAAARLLISRGS